MTACLTDCLFTCLTPPTLQTLMRREGPQILLVLLLLLLLLPRGARSPRQIPQQYLQRL